jgi:hypothetical protein
MADQAFEQQLGVGVLGVGIGEDHVECRCLASHHACHGVVPFFGQGMNCAFEDCYVLDKVAADNATRM